MVHLDYPSLMSPEERLRAIAALLVRGLERFKENGGTVETKRAKRKEAIDDLH
jgi:hypothetical protein